MQWTNIKLKYDITNAAFDRFIKGVGIGTGIILILVNFLNTNLYKELIAAESLFKEK